ncbi:MAG: hypothetical protein R3245_03375, partial [Kiloniellales bacterium]|nr:hypothetical protein [Kiloniellales bacterium]
SRVALHFVEASARLCRDRGFEPSYLIPPPPKLKQRKIISTEREEFFAMHRNFASSLRKGAEGLGLFYLDMEKAVNEHNSGAEANFYLEGSHCHPNVYLSAFTSLATS